MSKYLAIIKATLAQYLVYRLSFVMWRIRVIFSLLLIYFLWTSVYANKTLLFQYSKPQIVSYVLLIYLLGDMVFSSRTADIAGYIRSGEIINYILKPFPVLKHMFTKEAVDKLINVSFSVVEIMTLVSLLKPELFIQTNFFTYFWLFIALFFGIISAYFISFAISLIAFWSAEVWGPRFIFFILITVLSGSYFPLDILPPVLYNLLLLTPFPYFVYLPVKIYLNGYFAQVPWLLLISAIWAGLSFLLARQIWRKGIKEFSFFGR